MNKALITKPIPAKKTALLTTEDAAILLGLKRQGFLVLKNHFGIVPAERRRIKAKTPNNLYDSRDIAILQKLGQRCRGKGFRQTMALLGGIIDG